MVVVDTAHPTRGVTAEVVGYSDLAGDAGESENTPDFQAPPCYPQGFHAHTWGTSFPLLLLLSALQVRYLESENQGEYEASVSLEDAM